MEQALDYTPDRRVTPHLVALAGCVGEKLEQSGIVTCWGGVVAGDSLDLSEIGEDGAAWWVRLANLTIGAPGGQANGTVTCKPIMLANIGVGYATCYPISPDGEPLTPEQQLSLSDLVHAAMMALYRGMACCTWHQGNVGVGQVTVVTWTPQGPQGGVLGGEWLLQFEIIDNRPEPVQDVAP
jgi:hypothetical protein